MDTLSNGDQDRGIDNDHMDIADKNNWAEAVGMREQFKGMILKAKQMCKSLESSQFLSERMFETLAATGFRLTFRTMQRLITQPESRSNAWAENLDEIEGNSIEV